MSIELTVPSVGESITEVQIGAWLVAEGAALKRDQAVVEIESEKATVEVFAPTAGTLTKILKQTGETAAVGDVIGYMDEGKPAAAKAKAKSEDGDKKRAPEPDGDEDGDGDLEQAAAIAVAPKSESVRAQDAGGETRVMPAAKRIIEQEGLQTAGIKGTGPGGRVLKEDAIRAAAVKTSEAESAAPAHGKRNGEEVVRMSPMRRTIAARLVEAQQTAALLTTFNEIDMTAVMAARKEHQDAFTKKHEIKLGFMSFFVKACVDALKRHPAVNAEIRGEDIVYHNYYDIGIAVGGGKGLVVPVIRNADRLSFAEIELTIADFGKRAQENKIAIDELKGGTFTISNGGIYGSMLSTPIVNPPQSGILGLHAIKDRAVVVDGAVVVRPMMYVALTYDHRIVDGREAVTFLRRVVECIENPSRMLLEI